MAGTKLGGLKAAKTNKKKHGKNFYREIGRKGGRASTTGGFYANPELAKRAGAKGGAATRGLRPQTKVKIKELRRLFKNGYTVREAAAVVGWSIPMVYLYRNKKLR